MTHKTHKARLLIALLASASPLFAQDVIEVSYKDAGAPPTTLPLANIGKMWFADNMMQVSSLTAPTQVTKLDLSKISSIKFKNSQTDVHQMEEQASDCYTVYDLQGRQVLATHSKSAIDTLPHGIYIVKSKTRTVKISK